ncbi:MAG TPA: zinc finger Ran-binding domain-containing protein [Gemmatimonadales bacterium]|jgi:hypothetical protein
MAKDTDTTIEGLLQQRAQYEQWLARLDSTTDKAPAAVRQRVRADYEARLRGVIEDLRGHGATIAEELSRHQGNQAQLDGDRKNAEEALAEAEIRHAVGEYTDEEWRKIQQESEGRLEDLRSQLRSVGAEIARLAEVQSLIAASPRRSEPAAAPAAAPAPAPAPEPERPAAASHASAQSEESVETAPTARSAPRPSRPREESTVSAGASPPPLDELTFLKSVSDDEQKPSTRRASNPGQSSPAAARTMEAPPAASSSKTGAPGVAKTLKCGECGTLNRPTEWYCERCGAELAGI